MASYSLEVHAGGAAREALLRNGLRPELFGTLVGASGGPKWLVLSALDRLLFPWLGRALEVRHLRTIGSSIGAWRNLCLALPDPAAAIRRLEQAYIDQRYDTPPTPAEDPTVARRAPSAPPVLPPRTRAVTVSPRERVGSGTAKSSVRKPETRRASSRSSRMVRRCTSRTSNEVTSTASRAADAATATA